MQLGGAIGLAVLSTVAVTATKQRLGDLATSLHGAVSPHLIAAAATHGYDRAFVVGAIIALAGALVAAILIKVTRPATAVSRPGLSSRSVRPRRVRR